MSSVLHVAEPPARFRVNPPLVVDCSVLVASLFDEPQRGDADKLLRDRELHAPNIIEFEVTNVAVKKSQAGYAEVVLEALAAYEDIELTMHRINRAAVHELALRFRLSAYDASYLWLAAELKYPLATFDEQLAKVARRHLAGLN